MSASPNRSPEALDVIQRRAAIADWGAAYSNRRAIPDAQTWLTSATEKSAAFTERYRGTIRLGQPYADGDRQWFDVLSPADPVGTLIFVHGGYWRSTSTADHRHFAEGALQRGWRVVMPEYPLCPLVTINEIARSIATATERVAAMFPEGELILGGHSAGGHLVTYAASTDGALSDPVRRRIQRVVSISGLHDLRPLLQARDINDDLRLTAEEAAQMSPALSRPGHPFELVCICGGGELAEFRRQNALLANVWTGFGIATATLEIGELDHFRILDRLVDPGHPLTGLLTGVPLQG